MTDHDIQGGLEKWSVARGRAKGDRPVFQTPLNPESQNNISYKLLSSLRALLEMFLF